DRQEYKDRYPAIFAAYPHVLSAVDNPVHEHFRSIVNQVWTPLQIEKRRARIRAFVHELLDQLQEKDKIDFIKDFSLELPLKVILDFLGLPQGDWREVKANHLAEGQGSRESPSEAARG